MKVCGIASQEKMDVLLHELSAHPLVLYGHLPASHLLIFPTKIHLGTYTGTTN